jgi:hypothetical protein
MPKTKQQKSAADEWVAFEYKDGPSFTTRRVLELYRMKYGEPEVPVRPATEAETVTAEAEHARYMAQR